MRKHDYDLMHSLESDFWWFVGMRSITSALLNRYLKGPPRDILDVGCGTGINLLWMAQQFRPSRIVGCDFSEIAIGWCRESVQAAPSFSKSTIPRLSRGDVRRLPLAANSFDLATSLDVLDLFSEGDDRLAMAEIFRVLRPGGVAFVREPAYQWLLSSHDTVFETQHRYSTGELREKMSQAGFRVVMTTYANTILFPLAMTGRLLRKAAGLAADKTDAQPWPESLRWLNGIFVACMKAEASWLARGSRLPYGLSAICIGMKQDGD